MVEAVKAAADEANSSSGMQPAGETADQQAAHDMSCQLYNWSKASKAIMPTVSVSLSLHTLRDMCGEDAVIDPSCLTSIKTLGEGAFASVELCW
jgi:hypothetical protein